VLTNSNSDPFELDFWSFKLYELTPFCIDYTSTLEIYMVILDDCIGTL